MDAIVVGLAPFLADPEELRRRVASTASAPLSALAHAAYFDLLDAVVADDVEVALAALEVLLRRIDEPTAGPIRSWGDLDPLDRAVLLRHVNSDESTRVELTEPHPDIRAAATAAVREGMLLLDQAAPALTGEIRELVREIILVSGTVNDRETFDGATGFSTWGALFLNADQHRNRIEAIDGLSHESAHALLFGRAEGRALVENPPDERYASPLRSDARPLDGIFHATFVSARMHYAHRAVLADAQLDVAEQDFVRSRIADSRVAFYDGLATLQRHARLTAIADATLVSAAAYMEAQPLTA